MGHIDIVFLIGFIISYTICQFIIEYIKYRFKMKRK